MNTHSIDNPTQFCTLSTVTVDLLSLTYWRIATTKLEVMVRVLLFPICYKEDMFTNLYLEIQKLWGQLRCPNDCIPLFAPVSGVLEAVPFVDEATKVALSL